MGPWVIGITGVALATLPGCAIVLGYGDYTEGQSTTATGSGGAGGTGGTASASSSSGAAGGAGGGGLPALAADWTARLGDDKAQVFTQVAVAPGGDVLVVGNYQGPLDLFGAAIPAPAGYEVCAARLAAGSGAPVWRKSKLDTPSVGAMPIRIGSSIAVDSGGPVYLTGALQNATSGFDGVLVGLDGATGAEQWTTKFDGGTANGKSRVVVDSAHHVRMIAEAQDGHFTFGTSPGPAGGATGKDIALVSCAPPCAGGSITVVGGPGDDTAFALAADPSPGGALFLTGEYRGTWNGLPDTGATGAILVMKVDGNSAALWTRGFVKTQGASCPNAVLEQARGAAVAVLPGGDVVVTGVMCGETDFGVDTGGAGVKLAGSGGADVFVAVLAGSTGKVKWARAFGDANEQLGSGVAVGADGAVFVSGTFSGVLDFGGGQALDAGAVKLSIFLAELDGATGAHRRSVRFGAGEELDQRVVSLAAGAGTVALAGGWKTTLAFGDGKTLDPHGALDAFVARLSP
jgi:hypothetical protein